MNEDSTTPAPPASTVGPHPPHPEVAFHFTGRGAEYFRIWIVNLLLSVLSLGVYSAWAKVRREKYFHQHTRLAGAGFDFHGTPWAILRGRAAAISVLALSQIDLLPLAVTATAWATVLLAMPWLLQRSIRFRLANSSHRGLRFGFDGTARQAYLIFGGYALAAAMMIVVPSVMLGSGEAPGPSLLLPLGLFLLYPMTHASWRRFVASFARYGNLRFSVDFSRRAFIGIYLSAVLLWVLAIAVLGGLWGLTESLGEGVLTAMLAGERLRLAITVLFALLAYGLASAVWPYITARAQNLTWNHTRLGDTRFTSHLDPMAYVRLRLKNLSLTLLTLGLYRPFAVVANARMRVAALGVIPAGDPDAIAASMRTTDDQAVGAETVELLGFDLSL